MSRRLFSFAAIGTLLAMPALAQDAAATYPSRGVRIIVTVPAGGGVRFRPIFIGYFSAGGGNRTRTPLAGPRILSPVRLPVPPPRHVV